VVEAEAAVEGNKGRGVRGSISYLASTGKQAGFGKIDEHDADGLEERTEDVGLANRDVKTDIV
jgi:hypothetical protein